MILFAIISKIIPGQSPFHSSFLITCFTGLAFIAVIFTLFSLVIPLDHLLIQLSLLIPVIYWAFRHKKNSITLLKNFKEKLLITPVSIFLLFASLVSLILIMHTWFINHPDTLTYHAQNIQWIEKYRAIPGIIHLRTNYGIQSSWFVLCAIFSFSFTGISSLTFINFTVLIWLVLFINQRILFYLKDQQEVKILPGFLWLILLIICFASYTQIRLTATSASPDFIVTIYSWLIIFLFINYEQERNKNFYLLLVFLGFFIVTIKFSSIPLMILTLYAYYRYGFPKKIFLFLLPGIAGLVVLMPFLARNVISSGYLFFPFPYPDIIQADWKISSDVLNLTQQYITAYARTNADYNLAEIETVNNMYPGEWVPVWWHSRSLTDKIITGSIPILLLLTLSLKRRSLRNQNQYIKTSLLFLFCGIILWFIKAPDPRFAFGLLIPTAGILIHILIEKSKWGKWITRKWLNYFVLIFSILITGYSIYRLKNFFIAENIFLPAGVISIPYKTINCNGLNVNIPLQNFDCGSLPLPCSKDSCSNYVLRGDSIKGGFKLK